MLPSDRVAQLHPQAPGSLSVAFYTSQTYGGDILNRLHTWTHPPLQLMLMIFPFKLKFPKPRSVVCPKFCIHFLSFHGCYMIRHFKNVQQPLYHFVTSTNFEEELSAIRPMLQKKKHPFSFVRSFPPHLESVTYMCDLNTRHVDVTTAPLHIILLKSICTEKTL
jgi:hypothetical protein